MSRPTQAEIDRDAEVVASLPKLSEIEEATLKLKFEIGQLRASIQDGFTEIFSDVLACDGNQRQTAMLASRYLLHFGQVGVEVVKGEMEYPDIAIWKLA